MTAHEAFLNWSITLSVVAVVFMMLGVFVGVIATLTIRTVTTRRIDK